MKSIVTCAVGLLSLGAFCGDAQTVRMTPCGGAQVSVVQAPPSYNSWPMVQTLGDKVVCAYSRGSAHTIDEGKRGVFARTSMDGGGAMRLWVRRWGRKKGHDLYRTTDGKSFEKIASPAFSPMPMQVTDAFKVPGGGLMSLWFAGAYRNKEGGTWKQHVVEDDLPKSEWPTEQSAVHLGGGKILALARSEGGSGAQFQITSTDGGKTWKRARTNIDDVKESTPSLIYDATKGLISNYYYQRGAKKLKRRVVRADFIFEHPTEWPAPEILVEGAEARAYDAGNVNATVCGDKHLLATYSGTDCDCAVFLVSVAAP